MMLRWTSPERAAKMITKHRKVITAKDFFLSAARRNWVGHIGRINEFTPSCGCQACEDVRMNRK